MKLSKRLTSLFLVFVMLLSMVPSAAFAVNAAPAQLNGTMVSDPETLDGWKDYFGLRTDSNGNSFYSTEYAGAVWSDKTVLTQVPTQFSSSVTLGKDNFLVALSALASNSEIVGYSSIPTDTILVLDMSSSMNNASAIDELAVAANNAIKALYAENRDNRVGVVYYSGNDDTFILMPLDRYTSTSGNFLEHYTSGGRNGIRICRNVVKNSAGTTVNAGDTYHSGTFTQDGVYTAMKMLLDADKTVASGIQAGKERMPILVLMTDGEPTHTTNTFDGNGATYDTLNDASWVSGIKEGTGQEFLTQLTSAYAKYMLENSANRYLEHDLLFYTLGFDVQGTPSVLQPERSTKTDTLWNGFLNGNTIRPTDNQAVNSGNAAYSAFRAKLNSTAEEDIRPSINRNKYRYYVDGYFAATGADSLNAAFQTIVQEIILQSRYSPTLVSGNKNMSGYLTMSDEIGEFMEVKNINGILLGDTLYTGAMLTRMMATDMFGSSSTFTEAGWELVEVVSERIGIDQAAAIDLLTNAWQTGQLRYTSDTDFSNYIGFYSAEDGSYLGFYDESYGVEDAPVGAKYITRAYGFYGPTDGSIAGSNMLHIAVRLRTEIATGRQEVLFRIPSALIPIVSFDITISGDNLDDPGEVSLEHHEEDPIRLLFEVGLQSDITELNIAEKMEAAEYDHDNGDGTYSFYSNRWGSHTGGYDVDYDVPLTHLVADSHFHPSEENERFYFTENTLLCIDESGTPYVGAKPASGTFYHVRRVFKTNQASDGSAFLTNIYVPVSQAALETLIPGEDGTWYIPKDTIRRETTRFQVEKKENPTGTLKYSFYPLVAHPEDDDVAYDIFLFHGNNGKLTVSAATGIKLSKVIDTAAPDTAENFEFVISLAYEGAPLSGTYRLTRGETVSDLDFVGGQAKVTLKHGETVYITGLPAGATYTVTETAHPDYLATTNASGTLAAGQLADVNVINVPRGTGSLAVSKYVTHPLGSDVHIDLDFTVDVTLTNPLGQPLTGTFLATHSGNSSLTEITTDAAGKFSVTLKAGQTLVVYGLTEGSTATVVEPTVPTGFTAYYWEDGAYDDGVVTIIKDAPISVTVHNHYTPKEVYPVNVTVEGEKFFTGREGNQWKDTDTFTFQLQKNVDGVWQVLAEKTITGTDADKTFSFHLADMAGEKFTAVGEYTYQVVEVIPAVGIPGVTYDHTIHNFTVKVTDTDLDGQLEIQSVTSEHGHAEDITGDAATGWTVNADFTNTYAVGDDATAVTSVDLQKVLVNPSGSPLFALSGWVFDVYASADAATPIKAGTSVTTDAVGEARFVFNFGKADLEGAAVKEFTYYIKEVPGANEKVTYSNAAYEVKVELRDNGEAGMVATVLSVSQVNPSSADAVNADGELAFTNTYHPAGTSLPLSVDKQVLNGTGLNFQLKADTFAFELYDITDSTDIKLVEKVWNAADGTVSFANLQFNKVGEYFYRLSEVIPADADKVPGITYDPAVYHFHVHVEDHDGQLTATVHIDESIQETLDFTFTNSYSAKPVSQALGGTKVLVDSEGQKRDITHGMFEFALYDGTTELERVPNTTAGTFSFTAIEYTVPGTYEYTIKELPGALSYIGYSNAVYGATVVVADDNSDGQLEIQSVTYTLNGTAVEAAAYTNTYNPAPTTVWLEADKILENRAPVNGEFQFLVYATGSDFAVNSATPVVRSATNGADNANGNNVSFGGIEYTKPGVHYYVIAEDSSYLPKDDVSYDATLYRVTVVIFDAGSGQLGQHVTYNNGLVDVEKAEFTNVWHPPIPGTLTVKKVFSGLSGDKPNVTILVTGPDGFSRTVSLDEDNDWTGVLSDLPHGEYKIQEVSSGYVKDYELVSTSMDQASVSFDNDNTEHTITVTNTYEQRLGTLTVKKDFQGLPEALRPEIRVTVDGLLGFHQELVLNSSNNWTVTVEDLVWDLYTVTEIKDSANVDSYIVTYPVSQGVRFNLSNTTATVVLTNAYEARFGTLTVVKQFAGDVPANLPAEILATVSGPNGYSKDIVLNAEGGWKVTLTDLAWGKYTVTENKASAQVDNYVIESTVVLGSAEFTADNRTATLTIVNTYDERYGSLTVEKKFTGDVPANLPAEIKATVTGPNGYSKEVSLTAANGWKATLEGLAWGSYIVTENKESADVPNYVIDKITVLGSAVFNADQRTATVTITNTYEERFGTLTVEKKFDGDVPTNLPAEILVSVTGPNGYSTVVSLTAANGWKATLTDLAWGKYTVTENAESAHVHDYFLEKITVSGNAVFTADQRTATITLTNTYSERFGHLTVQKVFAGDIPADLPAQIRATVTSTKGYHQDIILTAENGWMVVLDKLPQATYTVTEDTASAQVANYVVTGTVDKTVIFTHEHTVDTVTVTNTYEERFGTLTVEKKFDGDVPATLPAQIRATVSGPNGYSKEVILTAANSWKATLTDLAWGTYTVTENEESAHVQDYAIEKITVSGSAEFTANNRTATITVTNTYDERFGDLTIRKVFAGDVPAKLPAEIRATVTSDKGYGKDIVLNAANNWTVHLYDLPQATYTVTEDMSSAQVANYAVTGTVDKSVEFHNDSVSGVITLTNTYEERFGTLTVEKHFDGDVPANLPAEIKATVTGPNGYSKEVILTAAGGWKATLEGLAWGTYTVTENEESAHVQDYAIEKITVSGTVDFDSNNTVGSIIVTNTYDERFGDLTIRKVFDGDIPAQLPAQIKLTVTSDKGYNKEIVLTAANSWTAHLYDLPQATYSVKEDMASAQVPNYAVTSSADQTVEFHNSYVSGVITVTNTYEERFGTLTVEKKFDGDVPANLPAEIHATVSGPNSYSKEVVLTASNGWKATLTDLAWGKYTVTENEESAAVPSYVIEKVTVSGTVDFDSNTTAGSITVTNTYEERFGTLTVRKLFAGDVPESLPAEIKINVKADNGYDQNYTLNAANDWAIVLSDLPWGEYTVTEDKASADVENYVVANVAVSGAAVFNADNQSSEITVTNTYDERFGDLTVKKVFAGDLPEGLPAEIRATVTSNKGYSKDIVLNAAGGWTVTLTDLPQAIYTVTEDMTGAQIANYAVTGAADKTVTFTDIHVADTVTLTNTYEERFGTLTVEKKFDGDVPANLPAEIKATVTGPNGYRKVVSLTAAGGWKATLTDLAWGTYTVTENEESAHVQDYAIEKITVSGNAVFNADNRTATVTVTNTYDERFGDLTIRKIFAGDVPETLPAEIRATVTSDKGYAQDIVLSAANDWTVHLYDLPQAVYSVKEDMASAQVPNYAVTSKANQSVQFHNSFVSGVITLTNTYEERFGTLTVEKKFAGDIPTTLPAEIKATVTGPNGYKEEVILNAAGGWKVTLTDLAWGTYTVTENKLSAAVENYVIENVAISGTVDFHVDNTVGNVTITNTYDERFGTLTVRKLFAGDVPETLPAQIIVNVKSDNGFDQSYILSAANNWTIVLSNLPWGEYTVIEDKASADVENYVLEKVTVSGTAKFSATERTSEITVTNTYDERFGDLTVEKKFSGDLPESLPDEIKATVTSDKGYHKNIVLTAANNWTVTLTDLPQAVYSVKENMASAQVPNYVVTGTVDKTVTFTDDHVADAITLTNTYEERFGTLTVEKKFSGDVPANLPAEIKATVTGPNGYSKEVSLTAAGGWKATLDKLAWGEYTVTENKASADVENYVVEKVTVSGNAKFTADNRNVTVTITNTYDERFGDLTVKKVFAGDLPASVRPAEIRATVTSNKGYQKDIVLNAANNWTVTLTDLPQAIYSVKEDMASAQVANYAVTGKANQSVHFTDSHVSDAISLINTYEERFGSLTVEKVFAGDLPASARPAIQATVTGPNGYSQEVTLNSTNSWKVILTKLPWGEYTVTENKASADVENYVVEKVTVSGDVKFTSDDRSATVTITNTYDERFGDLTVKKVFAGDMPESLPAQIRATVTSDKGYHKNIVLTAAGGWTVTLADLPQATYSVTEDMASAQVPNYVVTGTVDKSVSFTNDHVADAIVLTNTYEERFGDLTVRKVFAGDIPETLPAEIRATVTSDKGYRQEIVLNAANNWTVTLTDLPQAVYSVTENMDSAKVSNYIVSGSVDQSVEFTDNQVSGTISLINTYTEAFGDLTLVKTFEGDLPESARPEIKLTVTGPNGYEQEVILNVANNWTVTLERLPQGKYTVTEDVENADVKDYILDSRISADVEFTDTLQEATITVTNTYEARFGTLTIKKQFLGDLPEKLRPEIKVTVFGPDGYEQELLLNAANDWTATLSGLTQGLYTVEEDLPSGHVANYFFKANVGEGVTFTNHLTEATIVVSNDYRYIPETGDTFDPVIWTGISGVSAIALLVLLVMKRKKDDDETCEAN